MTKKEIAEKVVEILWNRIECGDHAYRIFPYIVATPASTQIFLEKYLLWDDEDENDPPENGETVESCLRHVEKMTRYLMESLQWMLTPAENN